MPSRSRSRYFWRRFERERVDDLLPGRSCRGSLGDSKMQHPAALVGQHHEDEQDVERDRRNGEEVDGDELFRVVAEKRSPRLRGWPALALRAILANRRGGEPHCGSMAPARPCMPSLALEPLPSHYSRQEPSALIAPARVCAGGRALNPVPYRDPTGSKGAIRDDAPVAEVAHQDGHDVGPDRQSERGATGDERTRGALGATSEGALPRG
jgi:hypothetical protein